LRIERLLEQSVLGPGPAPLQHCCAFGAVSNLPQPHPVHPSEVSKEEAFQPLDITCTWKDFKFSAWKTKARHSSSFANLERHILGDDGGRADSLHQIEEKPINSLCHSNAVFLFKRGSLPGGSLALGWRGVWRQLRGRTVRTVQKGWGVVRTIHAPRRTLRTSGRKLPLGSKLQQAWWVLKPAGARALKRDPLVTASCSACPSLCSFLTKMHMRENHSPVLDPQTH